MGGQCPDCGKRKSVIHLKASWPQGFKLHGCEYCGKRWWRNDKMGKNILDPWLDTDHDIG